MSQEQQPRVEIFYSDPVDGDGNRAGTAAPMRCQTPWGPVDAVKIPHEEMVTDPESTISARIDENGRPV